MQGEIVSLNLKIIGSSFVKWLHGYIEALEKRKASCVHAAGACRVLVTGPVTGSRRGGRGSYSD